MIVTTKKPSLKLISLFEVPLEKKSKISAVIDVINPDLIKIKKSFSL